MPIHFPFGKHKKKKKYLKATSPKWDKNSLKWDNNSLTFEPTLEMMDKITSNMSHKAESQITKAEVKLIAEESKENAMDEEELQKRPESDEVLKRFTAHDAPHTISKQNEVFYKIMNRDMKGQPVKEDAEYRIGKSLERQRNLQM